MKHFLLTIAGVFAGLMLFAIIAPIMLVGAVALATRPAPLAARSVLVLDLRGAHEHDRRDDREQHQPREDAGDGEEEVLHAGEGVGAVTASSVRAGVTGRHRPCGELRWRRR